MSGTIKIHSRRIDKAKPRPIGKVRTGERRPDGIILQSEWAEELYFNLVEDKAV